MIAEKEVFKKIVLKPVDDGGLRADWKIPADLPYFQGHFPGNPIFPAVGIVDATLFCLKTAWQRPKLFVPHFSVAKFLSPIQPEQMVSIEVKTLGGEEWQAEWKDSSSQKLLATMRFRT